MSRSIDEATAGRLELTGARARALLGSAAPGSADGGRSEGAEDGVSSLGDADARRIAARIQRHTTADPAAAAAIAADVVERARLAYAKLDARPSDADLTDEDALALESVMFVRGRPALRVFDNRLESLEHYPGSDFWQDYIGQYEDRIVAVAAATGAAIVSAPSTGNPPWVHGSAWLVAPDRVLTNRHVLVSDDITLVETGAGGTARFRSGNSVTIEFAADDRTPPAKARRRATGVLYLTKRDDPVDLAVLAIEPLGEQTPLMLAAGAGTVPNNLFVVGHPVLTEGVPDKVQAVFGKLDGRKRVSFGKRMQAAARPGQIVYDASTVGGYSGGPVLGISDGVVAGLHYYGDPVSGNLAISASAIRAHRAYAYFVGTNP
jgi:hypothetical protein